MVHICHNLGINPKRDRVQIVPIFKITGQPLNGLKRLHRKHIAVFGMVHQKQPVIATKLAAKIIERLYRRVILGQP